MEQSKKVDISITMKICGRADTGRASNKTMKYKVKYNIFKYNTIGDVIDYDQDSKETCK